MPCIASAAAASSQPRPNPEDQGTLGDSPDAQNISGAEDVEPTLSDDEGYTG